MRDERPAPLVLVTTPAEGAPLASHAAVAVEGGRRLAADLSRRLGALGAATAPLPHAEPDQGADFHWGRWFAAVARSALAAGARPVDAVGYAGGGSLALLPDADLDALLSPIAGEVVANNRFSADAFVVAGDLDRAIGALETCPTDNAAPRHLEAAGFAVRDLGATAWARFDVDTTLDLALLRLATRLEATRPMEGSLRGFLDMARLPGDRPLEVPHLAEVGAVIRDRSAELIVAGRVPVSTWQLLETDTACRVRAIVEERGMRSARDPGNRPRSVLAALMRRSTPADLVTELARLGDAVVLDSRVLMAAVAGSSEARTWPPEEERFASDFLDGPRIGTGWLRELVDAASASRVPFMLGGHALVSDGLRLVVAAAWQGR